MDKFNTTISGYSKDEVDSYMYKISLEYEKMLERLKQTDEKCGRLEYDLLRYKNLEDSMQKAILLAEQGANNMKKFSVSESKMILEDAKRNANKIINDAITRADSIDKEKEELRKKVINYKRKFKSILEDSLSEIDSFDEII